MLAAALITLLLLRAKRHDFLRCEPISGQQDNNCDTSVLQRDALKYINMDLYSEYFDFEDVEAVERFCLVGCKPLNL